ncbi:hypothetical protein F8Q88_00990 [Prevotella copri]|nr:hypothetical protein [Segatella copri]QNT67797.1 hypothetical protein FO447_02480 [Segatella copri]
MGVNSLQFLPYPLPAHLPGNFKASLGHAFFHAFSSAFFHTFFHSFLVPVIQEVQELRGIKAKDCYRFYTDIGRRKNHSHTYFLDRMQEKLNDKMRKDDELERMKR